MPEFEPIPLPQYATALAHLLRYRGRPAEEILARLGLSAEAFRMADEHWTAQLAQAHPQRKGILAMKFATAFAGARLAIGLDEAAGDAPDAAPLPAEPFPLSDAPVEVPVAVPSFMRDDLAGSAPARAPVVPVAAIPVPVAPVVPPLVVPERPRVGAGTAIMPDLAGPAETPLPFRADAPSPLAVPSVAPATPPVGTGTAIYDAEAPAPEATPWEGPAPKLGLDHYAVLAVLLSRKPPDRASVLARYGITSPEEHRHLDEAYKAHFRQNPAARARYEALVLHYSTMMHT